MRLTSQNIGSNCDYKSFLTFGNLQVFERGVFKKLFLLLISSQISTREQENYYKLFSSFETNNFYDFIPIPTLTKSKHGPKP